MYNHFLQFFHLIQWKEEFHNMFSVRVSSNKDVFHKKRIEYIDLAKGICIFLVVFHHVALNDGDLEYTLKNFFKMFRMPLYFTLSGLFFKSYSGFFDFSKRKINKLLIPYLVFFCIGVFVNDKNGAIWFLLCLFFINLLFYIIYDISQKNSEQYQLPLIIGLTFLIGFIGYFLGKYHINIKPYVTTAFTALPFFAIGYVLRKKTNILTKNKYDKYLLLYAVIFFFLCFFLSGYVNYRKNEYEINIVSLYIGGLAGIMGVIFIAKQLKRIPLLSYCGRYSIIILLTHMWVIHLFEKSLLEYIHSLGINLPEIVIVLILSILFMLCYIIIIPVMKSYFPHVTAQKDLL